MSDIEQLLRDRLQAAAPSFREVSVHEIGYEVQRRRRTTRGAVILAAAVLSGTAIIAPLAVLGSRNHAMMGGNAASGGAAVSDAGGRASGPYGAATPSRDSPSAATTRPCPPPYPSYVAIDYVDFVRFGGREYIAGQAGVPGTAPATTIGGRIGTVRCELSAIVPDPSYHPVDGDAGYLKPGTTLYAIKGVATSVRIAARVGDTYHVYQVYQGPSRTR